ncbi:SDR family NAD(P)-dependent oxidoreductase [Novosphingobium sp. P6W]|uniref:SDR family NAD(P)-dependent oxidoreductase n=1 Tax=Novosphingobium sp. P6W TaxID=1609758 RepID=UPI0005C2EEA5|nr:SDR family oxidoreductase [Novosphingobium sp. P6W]AXB78922.1 SDR family NAD(P)-dependent oxidoreductase [Novosphingobium sp. P6W]KIS30043.1 oxidoreductase [Novosphingobium sp. P6W]
MNTGSKKVALVFGGSRGIGAAAVARFAKDDYRVAFTYASREDKANEVVSTVEAAGGEAFAIKADSADARQIESAVAQAVQKFGKIDALVVNAGIFTMGTVDAVPVEQLDQMLDINVRGVFLAIQAAATQINDGGRVITVGSNVAIRTGMAGASVYQFTKAAVAAMVKGVALDLAPRSITVNNVQPGPTDTDINAGAIDFLADKSPLKRVAKPSEIAGLIAYIASEEAGYMTGASITIDGGFTL